MNHPDQVKGIELFIRLQGDSSKTNWYSYNSMKSKGNGLYQITVKSSQVEGADKFDSATLLYQFIANDGGKNIIGRSETYGDVTMTKCASINFNITLVHPLPVIISPTPIFIK